MTDLVRFTLTMENGSWVLVDEDSRTVARIFRTKVEAMKGGTLKRAMGRDGGTVRIRKATGQIQEERTYLPRRDPRQPKA
ncbi:MAG: DUF2188 domain-containing protein [Betaproteobacteria bacterium]